MCWETTAPALPILPLSKKSEMTEYCFHVVTLGPVIAILDVQQKSGLFLNPGRMKQDNSQDSFLYPFGAWKTRRKQLIILGEKKR